MYISDLLITELSLTYIWYRGLLSVQPAGKLSLAVRNVLEVSAALHEGVDLGEDAGPVGQLSEV